jgi:hypothetical protein
LPARRLSGDTVGSPLGVVLSGKLDGLGFSMRLMPFDPLPFTMTGP